MNSRQKRFTVISLILVILSLLIPFILLAISGVILSIVSPAPTPEEETTVFHALALLAEAIVACLIALTVGSVISAGTSYGAYRLAGSAIAAEPEDGRKYIFPRVLRILAGIEIGIFTVLLLAVVFMLTLAAL